MAFDYDTLIAPVSEAAPCGPDLRGEPDFRDIEDAPGDFAGLSATDLRKVVGRCAAFLQRTKDQMPAIVAAQAAARAGDFAETLVALRLAKDFAALYWDDFHPGPAEEMAIGRLNELSALSRPAALILPLQRTAIARLPAPSTVEFTAAMLAQACAPVPEWTRDNEEALAAQLKSGVISAANGKTTKATHEGARMLRLLMRSIAPEAMAADSAAGVGGDPIEGGAAIATALRAQVVAASAPLGAISDTLYDIMELYSSKVSESPSFGPVLAQLKFVTEAATAFLAAFPDPDAVVEPEVEEAGSDESAAGPAQPGVAPKPRGFSADTPRNRADVAAAIEAICRFYAETEPSSPVPLMLRRVATWVNKDFLQLMEEIGPNGVGEATKLLATPGG